LVELYLPIVSAQQYESLARVEKLTKQLIREGLIVPKPTGYGMQVSLNPRQNEVIIVIMKKFSPEV